MLEFVQGDSQEFYDHIRELFTEYAAALNIDMCFQNIARELAELPGQYGPPRGCLLLARQEAQVAGCAALRMLAEDICEMKRLFVRPAFRGQGLGRELAAAIIKAALKLGYSRMRLDTVAGRMKEAVQLYRSLGFKEIEPYNIHPVESTMFMELNLEQVACM